MQWNKQMNVAINTLFAFLRFLPVIIIFLLAGCRPAPSDQMVKDLIMKHFETEKYHVVALDTGDLQPLPLAEKTYMGTSGFQVTIRSITVEIKQDMGSPSTYRKGEKVTFKNCSIRIKEQPGQTSEWIIAGITGIPLP